MNSKITIKISIGILLIFLTACYSIYKNENNKSEKLAAEDIPFEETEKQNTEIVIDIGGEVTSPGVIKLPDGSRIYEAINKAGGITPYADIFLINTAEVLKDGQKVFVPKSQKKSNISGLIPVTDKSASGSNICISISGRIKKSGVIILPENSRVNDAVEASGGMLPDADAAAVNLAEKLTDGMKIYIAKQGEKKPDSSLVNINLADASQLDQLNGIGPSLAAAIIDYREKNGKFKNIEEIKNVSGIGNKTFEKFKDKICVY